MYNLFVITQNRNLSLPGLGVPQCYEDIVQYFSGKQLWERFHIVNNIIGGDIATIEYIGEAFVERQNREEVYYAEVRHDPQRLSYSDFANLTISMKDAVNAVQRGIARGMEKYPKVRVYQLVCAMRDQPVENCFDIVRLAIDLKSNEPGGVVGMDLAGDEAVFNNTAFVGCFKYAHDSNIKATVHAGEFSTSPEEIVIAVNEMYAKRIGHGYAMVNSTDVAKFCANNQEVHFECCPGTAQYEDTLYAVAEYPKIGINFGLNTDDPSDIFFNQTMPKVEDLVKNNFGWTEDDFKQYYINAKNAAFGPI